ncbi:MAG: AAA family ATPase [Clostridia bacterium]|nr:AAA family ATPase [Clostridia bacterium]
MLYLCLSLVQLGVTLVVGCYFYRQLRAQQESGAPERRADSRAEMERLQRMRRVRLTPPLSERVRPARMEDIVGQEDGVRALRAVLCCENPQHVIIYGPPGVGKTCAARLVLDEARRLPETPFAADAPFIEMDATTVRFDERAIADPLIGSVHDPIYQGAGQLGVSGVPQPKPGAVTRANGGVLFLDEIGELHPTQMNKLLKVLEDRLVRFESAYYSPSDRHTPRHIHDIFKNGLPADFRLVGATTRAPEELPPALRSRCMEIFFRPLEPEDLSRIAGGAAEKAGFSLAPEEAELVGRCAESGREAVNIVQMAAGLLRGQNDKRISREALEWVFECGHHAPRALPEAPRVAAPGRVTGLAVHGAHEGALLPIEAAALPGRGRILVSGIVCEEELSPAPGRTIRRRSTAQASADNAATLLRRLLPEFKRFDVHVNFPGGAPVDGPSAGLAMAVAAWSAVTGAPVAADLAMTGEISVLGDVLPVGGVGEKLRAAQKAHLKRALIPMGNDQAIYRRLGIEVIPVSSVSEALALAASQPRPQETLPAGRSAAPLAASPALEKEKAL